MADSRAAETLRNKRAEIARSIDDYEARLAQAKADPAHMDAAIAIQRRIAMGSIPISYQPGSRKRGA